MTIAIIHAKQKNITLWLPNPMMLSAIWENSLQLSVSEMLAVVHLQEGVAVNVHSQVNMEETAYIQGPCDGSAAGWLTSPAWNGTHE